jgi:hypothetical protein
VDKPVGACHPQVRKRYIPVPLLTIAVVVDALSLIHPTKAVYQIELVLELVFARKESSI